ncbi:uncharacterized protein LOC110023442 [Phalaenopsis equestris]|uniref:uncharacterized protein LOC110023442 n=1 Tax=Phalaenopsis equestris TaxID=78828 RepID=UPI0009E3677C|nr:uncharacterized protein LOC110023442 [Phalaenopsis equestris]
MNFLEQVRAFPMPFANSLCITEGSLACSIPIIKLSKQGSKMLSTIQFRDDISQDKGDNLAILHNNEGEKSQRVGMPRNVVEARDKPPSRKMCCTKEKPKIAKCGGKSKRQFRRCRGSRNEGIAGLSGGECHAPPYSRSRQDEHEMEDSRDGQDIKSHQRGSRRFRHILLKSVWGS